jgi:hypothetical protein
MSVGKGAGLTAQGNGILVEAAERRIAVTSTSRAGSIRL